MPKTTTVKQIRLAKTIGISDNANLDKKPCLVISTPSYDLDLVESIKKIDSSLRSYDPIVRLWSIAVDQVDYVRSICQEAAEYNGWLFIDETALSVDEIDSLVSLRRQMTEADHIAKSVAVLEKIPNHCLSLCRWGKQKLQIQLSGYIGEDLFQELCSAAIAYSKPVATVNSKHELEKFSFEFLAKEEILRALADKPKKVFWLENLDLAMVEEFESGVAHFVDPIGNLYAGAEHTLVDTDSYESKEPWKICVTNSKIYVVDNVKERTIKLLKEKNSFGTKPELLEFIQSFKLISWFQQWVKWCLDYAEVEKGFQHDRGWKLRSWKHPSDLIALSIPLVDPEDSPIVRLAGLTQSGLDRLEEIQRMKEEKARESRERDRSIAKELAIAELRKHLCTKEDFRQYASLKCGIQVKSSWTTERLLEEITKDKSSCLKIIGLSEVEGD